jgi:hypothetical protein
VDTTFDETLYTTAIDKSGGGITEVGSCVQVVNAVDPQRLKGAWFQPLKPTT